MKCWKCHTPFLNPEGRKLSFRASCDKCNSDLHSCRTCKFHKPGMNNECLIPGNDWVADREKNNFCEEFVSKKSVQEIKPDNSKKKFESMFKE